ncbi:Uncharacterised protein [Neisseria meningitidis]|nr:Uncharacterised protein [Neisseria meningitidis]
MFQHLRESFSSNQGEAPPYWFLLIHYKSKETAISTTPPQAAAAKHIGCFSTHPLKNASYPSALPAPPDFAALPDAVWSLNRPTSPMTHDTAGKGIHKAVST